MISSRYILGCWAERGLSVYLPVSGSARLVNGADSGKCSKLSERGHERLQKYASPSGSIKGIDKNDL